MARGSKWAAGIRRMSSHAIDPSRVAIERGADGVAQVRLLRADKMNALDMPMFRSIAAAARQLMSDRSVRAVVLHGEGRAFCAGLDVKSVSHPLSAKANVEELLARKDGEISNLAQDVGYLWRRVPAPVIAATHGVCFGGGFQIALGADMRVATPTCRFSVMEAKWGLIPDMRGRQFASVGPHLCPVHPPPSRGPLTPSRSRQRAARGSILLHGEQTQVGHSDPSRPDSQGRGARADSDGPHLRRDGSAHRTSGSTQRVSDARQAAERRGVLHRRCGSAC